MSSDLILSKDGLFLECDGFQYKRVPGKGCHNCCFKGSCQCEFVPCDGSVWVPNCVNMQTFQNIVALASDMLAKLEGLGPNTNTKTNNEISEAFLISARAHIDAAKLEIKPCQ